MISTSAQILTAYEGTMEGGLEAATPEAYEHSEMMLYKVQVLLEGGSCADALELLDAVKVGTPLRSSHVLHKYVSPVQNARKATSSG